MNPLKRLFLHGQSRGWRRHLSFAGLFSVLNKIFDIFPEILIGMAIDIVIKREQSYLAQWGIVDLHHQLYTLGLLTFVIWLLESVTQYVAEVKWRQLAQKIQHQLRIDAVNRLQHLKLTWFESQNSGQILSILNEDVNQIERFLNGGFHQIIQISVSTLLIGCIFFYISPSVALFAFVPVPLILGGAYYFRSRLGQRYANVRTQAGELGAQLSGVITGVVTIRSKVAEQQQLNRVENSSLAYASANEQAIRLSSAVIPVVRMAVLSGFLFTLILGGLQTISGDIPAASYTVLVFLTQRLLWPFTGLGEVIDLLERSLASVKRVMNLLDQPQEQPKLGQPLKQPVCGSIRFDQVSFSYQSHSESERIIRDCSLKIVAGSFIGIVGPTGAGKSTLIKLILGFYEPTEGELLFDDQRYSNLDYKSLRKQIGYVGQDVFLMDDTIAANLRLGYPDASDQELEEACLAAEIHHSIVRLPEGYQTAIGERGVKLSGGQRQRLAIARGLLGKPPVLILDEATSAVDNETEAAIQRSLEKVARGRTMIVIAHRLSTIRRADKIYIMNEGSIVQSGHHDQLVEQKGLYQDLWAIQTGMGTSLQGGFANGESGENSDRSHT